MFRQIRYFQAAAQYGSLKEAAEECFVSIAVMDKQIRELERGLSAKLLERRGHGCTLTAAGEDFYERSLRIAPDLYAMTASAVHIAHRGKGQLYLGCLNGYNGREFQRTRERFAERCPELAVQVVYGSHGELYEHLLSGRIDLVVGDSRQAFRDAFAYRELAGMQCFIELSTGDPLAWQVGVEAGQLIGRTAIAVSSQRQDIQSLYREVMGIGSPLVFVEGMKEARRRVARGDGYMLVTGGARSPEASGLRYTLLLRGGEPVSMSYCLFWRKDDQSPYVQEFGEQMRSLFAPTFRR